MSHPTDSNQPTVDRRTFLLGTAAALAPAGTARADSSSGLKPIIAEVDKRHAESVRRIQDWVRQPTIAAENKGINEGCDLMMRMLREAGCNQVVKCATDLHPGVFATLDSGAARAVLTLDPVSARVSRLLSKTSANAAIAGWLI